MLQAYLGGLTGGRLGRLPFLGLWLLLWVLFALYGLGIAFGIGVVEPLVFEGAGAARDRLLGHFGPRLGPGILAALGLFVLLFVFAQLNLLAKRIRDMGLPGWPVLLLLVLAAGALAYVLPPGGTLARPEDQANGAFNGFVALALLLIPGGFFTRRVVSAPSTDDPSGSGDPMSGPAAGPVEAPGAPAPTVAALEGEAGVAGAGGSEPEPPPEAAPEAGLEKPEHEPEPEPVGAEIVPVPVPDIEPAAETRAVP